MLGIILLMIGAVLIVVGALHATSWVDTGQHSQRDVGFEFITGVVAPLMGGGLLVIMGLMELDVF